MVRAGDNVLRQTLSEVNSGRCLTKDTLLFQRQQEAIDFRDELVKVAQSSIGESVLHEPED